MQDPLSRDVESGDYVKYNEGEKGAKTAAYFWHKPKLYVCISKILIFAVLLK
jgi:hypothetical protein